MGSWVAAPVGATRLLIIKFLLEEKSEKLVKTLQNEIF